MSTAAASCDPNPRRRDGTLNDADYVALELSWITRQLADEAMLRRVSSEEGRQIVGQKGNRDCAGILIPYYWPGAAHPHTYRLRRDKPDMRQGRDGKPRPSAKYLAPPGDRNRLYIPPGVTLQQLNDPTIPIVLVEGEKKALALWRLANYECDVPRFIPVAIPGAWNWRGKIGKTWGPNGESVDVNGPIADLSRVPWDGRTVFIVFDTNVHTNDSVKWARTGISRELASRGADVKLVNLPEDCGVNGVDDLLATWGPDRVLKLFDSAIPGAQQCITVPMQFKSEPGGMFRVTGDGDHLTKVQLTNFQAKVVANIQVDDGVETKWEFDVESELRGRTYRFTLPASEFMNMNWPAERMGATAIVLPNRRDYARAAIQSQSLTATEECMYTHTGWRKVKDQWVFLHAGGAIGATGPVPETNVRLFGVLNRYELAPPATPTALKCAVKATLRLLRLGPSSVSLPLFALTVRSPFGNADFSGHLAGTTGAFKTEIAALHQQFFGAAMTRLNLRAHGLRPATPTSRLPSMPRMSYW